MSKKLMINVPFDDYIELVRDRARLDAILDFAKSTKYSIDKVTLYAISGRPAPKEEEEEI